LFEAACATLRALIVSMRLRASSANLEF
jgi:hypothetical protein